MPCEPTVCFVFVCLFVFNRGDAVFVCECGYVCAGLCVFWCVRRGGVENAMCTDCLVGWLVGWLGWVCGVCGCAGLWL